MNQHVSKRLRAISNTTTASTSKGAYRALKALWKRTPAPERHQLFTILRMKANIPAILPWQTKKLAKILAKSGVPTPLSA